MAKTGTKTKAAPKAAATGTKPRKAAPKRKTPAVKPPSGGPPSGGLVIVESPAKAKTISKYLGRGYRVMASVGHVKDLPKSGLGIDIEHDFAPEYVTIKGKEKILSGLRAAAREAEAVYLASDPDREGEAIAWHVAEAVRTGNKRIFRVLFNEITARGIERAMAVPTVVDMNRVNAQQARRVLDRLVGYQISPLLWQKVRYGLSAGRVQSVAIRLVCERERAIAAFVPEESWSIAALLRIEGEATTFWARLIKQAGQTLALHNEIEATAAVTALNWRSYAVSDIEKKERKQRPTAPFITSRLQQDAVRMLHFSPQRTMALAQQLYEGVELGAEGSVGLITYMRTDSVRISPDFQAETLDWIGREYGREYLPATPNFYRSKKAAQEAHEAIRPTSMAYPPDAVRAALATDQFRLYDLIWKRYVASQMAPAVLDVTRVDIAAGDFTFRATGSVIRFDGFRRVYMEGHEEGIKRESDEAESAESEDGLLPVLSVGQSLAAQEIRPKQHFTQPLPRYNEALLIHDLEEKGIGRPSTYAAILTTIQEREYAERREGRFHPTDLGVLVCDLLVENFPDVVDVGFTARMEDQLDQIEAGEAEWVQTLRDFYTPFSQTLAVAKTQMRNMKSEETPTDIPCEKCGLNLAIKWGRFGRYLACPGYPDCKNTKEFVETATGIQIVPKETLTNEICGTCGKPFAIKTGRFGRFMACTGYPECKTTKPIGTGVACRTADCTGAIVEKQSRTGKTFYSCNRYPECKFALWDRPVSRPCPACQAVYLVEKASRGGAVRVICADKACGYQEEAAVVGAGAA